MAWLFWFTLLAAPAASAHQVGLSIGQYRAGDTDVDSNLTFSAEELRAVGDEDATAAARSLTERLRLARGGQPCTGRFEGTRRIEGDGIVVSLHHTCSRTGPVTAELEFLDSLSPGHRHLATLVGGRESTEIVLHRGQRELRWGTSNVSPEPGTNVAWQYFLLGGEHILIGLDHLLFLCGLVLLSLSLRHLLWAVTAFSLAHSVTLGVSALGWFQPSPGWIEPLIALSVVLVGVENWLRRPPARVWPITFAVGLLHGFGFAGALTELGLPQGRVPLALVSFNLGVEVGQLLIVAIAVPALALLKRSVGPERRLWIRRAASAGLVGAGALWFFDRLPAPPQTERRALQESAPRAEPEAFSAPVVPAPSGPDDARYGLQREPARAEREVLGPVYSDTTGPVDPLVAQLCASLTELPRRRRAECAGHSPGPSFAAQCTRMLGAAARSGAIALDRTRAERCLVAWTAQFEGCEWLDAPYRSPPGECGAFLRGTLEAGAVCRSSLECSPGLHCRGLGPMDPGACAPPGAAGTACGRAIDPLAALVPGALASTKECAGSCVNQRCTSHLLAAGRGRH